MKTLTVYRSGDRPLQFEGEIIDTINTGSDESTRWFECLLARTEAGTYVAGVSYHTRWTQQEEDYE